MIPVVITPHRRPKAPPPTVRLIEPLKEQLRRLGINKKRGPENEVWDAGYRNSPQIAALLETRKCRATLHPLVERAVSEMEQNEVVRDITDDNEYSKNAGSRKMRIARIAWIAGAIFIAPMIAGIFFVDTNTTEVIAQNKEWIGIGMLSSSVFATIAITIATFSSIISINQRAGAAHVLIDRVYELLSDTGNQEKLAQRLAAMERKQ